MWHLYILRLSDNSLYTGITTDLERRIKEHRNGEGSKYVRSRLPCEIVYTEELEDRSAALKREAEIKSWKKDRKEELVS
ncbi:MAG: GIY-YIG nuclease family protein [Candidatus Thermoplasmatota archaeon]|nr:GIY-YIG nuclease family protein [Candidatus Thermoplasmatota archaeon]